MATVSITFHRLALNNLLHSESGPVGDDLKRRARNVKDRAYDMCPKATMNLANSIHVDGPREEGDDLQISVIADADYAIYVEKGTRYMAAQPFLEPALDAFSH